MSEQEERRVALVVADDFADRLVPLARRVHVWIVDRPANRAAAEVIWAEQPETPDGSGFDWRLGVTAFLAPDNVTAEQLCLDVLPNIEKHHSMPFTDEPWDALEVYGVELTPAIRQALNYLGFVSFESIDDGFTCSK